MYCCTNSAFYLFPVLLIILSFPVDLVDLDEELPSSISVTLNPQHDVENFANASDTL